MRRTGCCYGEPGHVLRVTGRTPALLEETRAGPLQEARPSFNGGFDAAMHSCRISFGRRSPGLDSQRAEDFRVAVFARPVERRFAVDRFRRRISALCE